MLASGNQLFVGQVEEIELVVNVTVLSSGNTYLNKATASGTSITGAGTTDQSTDGLKPDITATGDVSSSIPTPVDLKRPNGFIPQGFSPNGDGVHDTFVIENVSGRRIYLEVYNRWGNLVYRNNDYRNEWGGKCNQGIHIGDDLPEGTYYYIVKFDDTDRYVGYITLNR
jgi:gliding motility-associated-like protein